MFRVLFGRLGKTGCGQSTIDFVSNHVEKMLGYSREEWLSTQTSGYRLFIPTMRRRAAAEAAAIFASGKGLGGGFGGCTKTGVKIWIERSIVVCDEWAGRNAWRRWTSLTYQSRNRTCRTAGARKSGTAAGGKKQPVEGRVSGDCFTRAANATERSGGMVAITHTGQLDEAGVKHAVEVIERNAAAQRQIIEDLSRRVADR